MRETLTGCEELFQAAVGSLPESQPASEDKVATRVIAGINLTAERSYRGIYRFSEARTAQDIKHELVLESAVGWPAVRGVIIEQGNVTRTVGMRGASVESLLRGFLGCERFLTVQEMR